MEHLISKYLQGDLTLDEQHELSKWIQSNEKNAETLNKIHAYWHYHKDSLDEEELEVRLRLLSMMTEERSKSMSGLRMGRMFFKIAASLLLVCSLIFALYQYNSSADPQTSSTKVTLVEKVSLPGQKITTILPDGSQVKLNADSKLIVPPKFEGETREVTLIGEAFFDVKRDEQHPFIIKTDKVEVRVLGTSFNVQAYKGDASPSIAVKTGKVSVKSRETNREIDVLPDEMVQLSNQNLMKSAIPTSAKPFAWTNQQLAFDDETLAEVLEKISRWYGVEIQLNSDITLDKKITAHYDNPTLVEMMDILGFVYDFKYQFSEDEQIVVIQ